MNQDSMKNYSIHCTVKDCKYHNKDENYCSLDSVRIASNEQNPKDESCVDCKSFECEHGGLFS